MKEDDNMDLTHRLAISYYKTIATINEAHKVYLVQHQETNRIFVKKILDVYNIDIYENLYNNPIPGTARIIDFCEDNNQLLLIEEYISGTPLSDIIKLQNLSDRDVIDYMLDLCNILEKLHSLNPPIVHRDIKPSNIIITNYNKAILLDFNAAKQFSAMSKEDTVLLGTQGYAAPEQYGFGSSSPQTDIYSLGIVLKEMLKSSSISSSVLDKVADKCTQMDPKERFSSISEIKRLIFPLKENETIKFLPLDLQKFLPPGYRTKSPWKIFTSSIVYLFIFWLCLSLNVENTYGIALWLERISCLAIMLAVVFFSFNYLNVQQAFPICQHKNKLVRYLGIILIDIGIVFGLLIVLFIIEALI